MKRGNSTLKQNILDLLVGLACILVLFGSIALGFRVSGTDGASAPPNNLACYKMGPTNGACR